MKDKFTLANGQLSVYALACGYLQQYPKAAPAPDQVTLWHEGACFHVRRYSNEKGMIFWESFHSIGEARKLFAKTKQAVKKGQ
jgi:hypothetical protein